VTYILTLLAKLKNASIEEQERQKKALLELVAGESQLRSKRELIEKFIQENLPLIEDSDLIPDVFEEFWDIERRSALEQMCIDENLKRDQVEGVIGNYLFTEKAPLRDNIISLLQNRPALSDRATTAERVTAKIVNFVETFISGVIR
jgi:type I restriction enzyme R subunit